MARSSFSTATRLRCDGMVEFDTLPFDGGAERLRRFLEADDIKAEEGRRFVERGEDVIPGRRVGAGRFDGEVDVGALPGIAAGAGAEEDDAADMGVGGQAGDDPVGDGAGSRVHGASVADAAAASGAQRMVKEPAAIVTQR